MWKNIGDFPFHRLSGGFRTALTSGHDLAGNNGDMCANTVFNVNGFL